MTPTTKPPAQKQPSVHTADIYSRQLSFKNYSDHASNQSAKSAKSENSSSASLKLSSDRKIQPTAYALTRLCDFKSEFEI